jgi:ribose-phosphate pyrophosphokinase
MFSGSANVPLVTRVARYLGMDWGPMVRKQFAMESYIFKFRINRGCDVYLIQPRANR